jgi:peptide deformylase
MNSKFTRKNIIVLPHPHLRQKSDKVHVITKKTLQLVEDMKAAALDWEASRPNEVAVALAAVQIDVLERVVIIREDFDDKENKNFITLINPEVVKYEGNVVTDQEGCLSVSDVYGLVPRYEKVRVKAVSLDGHEIRVKSPTPFIARILQHEIDHCNGKCFVDHIANDKNAFSILTKDGELQPVKYSKVKKMGILLDD